MILGLLVLAAWYLPVFPPLPLRRGGILRGAAALALAWLVHRAQWGLDLNPTKLAVDLGVFSAVVVALRMASAGAARVHGGLWPNATPRERETG
jgi:hypothetical protein